MESHGSIFSKCYSFAVFSQGVTVIAEGEHLCMKMRGVRNNSTIITIANRGLVEQNDARAHLLALIYDSKPKIHTV